jgi:hypothetical protein
MLVRHIVVRDIITTETSIGTLIVFAPKPIWDLEAAGKLLPERLGGQVDTRGCKAAMRVSKISDSVVLSWLT